MRGAGFREFGVSGSQGSGIKDLGSRVQDVGFRVDGFEVLGLADEGFRGLWRLVVWVMGSGT